MGGLTKKIFNMDAARTILSGTPELNVDEKRAVEQAFPDAQTDYGIGATIYLLRTRLQASKRRVATILGADQRTLIRYFSALEMSPFLKIMIEDSFQDIQKRRPDIPIDVPDGLPFETRLKIKTKMALEITLDAIISDPTKMYEADLEGSVNAAKKLHEMHRLDSGKSTQNIATVFHINDGDQERQEAEEDSELADLDKSVNKLHKLLEKHSPA